MLFFIFVIVLHDTKYSLITIWSTIITWIVFLVPREMGARPKQIRRDVPSASTSEQSVSHEEAGSSTEAAVAHAERPGKYSTKSRYFRF